MADFENIYIGFALAVSCIVPILSTFALGTFFSHIDEQVFDRAVRIDLFRDTHSEFNFEQFLFSPSFNFG